jgi:hypothetical protein
MMAIRDLTQRMIGARLRRFHHSPIIRVWAILTVLLACDVLGGHPDEPEPTIELSPSFVTLEVGQTVVINAEVTGTPSPVLWSVGTGLEVVSRSDRSITLRAISVGDVGVVGRVDQGNRDATATALVRVVPATGGTLPTGTRTAPQAQPEGAQTSQPTAGLTGFGPWPDRYVAVMAGAPGWTAVDLATGDVLHQPVGLTGGPYFGVAAASQDPPGTTSTTGFVAFGAGGYAIQNVIDGEFTATAIGFGTTYDAYAAGGRKVSNVITLVHPGAGVGFVQYDGSANAYFRTSETVPAPATGELVSAYLHDGSGTNVTGGAPPILLLTRAVQSIVWLNRRDGSASTNELTLGLDARKLRCIGVTGGGALCGVTLFGADRVTMFTWDGAEAVTFASDVPVGDGPVDLDLRLLPNGNVAMVTTGFNNGAITEAELTPAGAVVSSETTSVPAGCTGAGHAVYIQDAAGLKIVGTCYSSNQYYIVESRF